MTVYVVYDDGKKLPIAAYKFKAAAERLAKHKGMCTVVELILWENEPGVVD